MPTDDVNRLRCDDCGCEQYLDHLHAAGLELFCEICIVGREVAWQMTPWQPPDDLPRFAV
jgi:hypothetical protein